jgi:hypothetical protein
MWKDTGWKTRTMWKDRLEDKDNVERNRLEDEDIAGNKIKTDHKETNFSFEKMDRKLTVEPEEGERTDDCKLTN